MSRWWKTPVMVSLILNAVCLVYLYALLHSNPHGPQYYEMQQIRLELMQMKDALDKIKAVESASAG